MCYDVKAQLSSQLKRARLRGDEAAAAEILEKLKKFPDYDHFHTSGFSHPKLFIYKDIEPLNPELATWGLLPSWAKNKDLWNNTLNARGETIFDKPAFRESAKKRRCLLYVDGFYEHHHFKGETYPYYIFRKNLEPMTLAGLWSDWTDRETGEIITTFSIVTTNANKLLTKIHNNPKLKGPRMPVILPEELEDEWLKPIEDDLDKTRIEELICPYPDEELDSHTVGRLRGSKALGNVSQASEEVKYEELTVSDGKLF